MHTDPIGEAPGDPGRASSSFSFPAPLDRLKGSRVVQPAHSVCYSVQVANSSDDALRALARALAPLIADELGLERGPPAASLRSSYDAESCRRFVSALHLGDTVLLRSQKFFARLVGGGQIGSLELVALLKLKGATRIPANLTNSLKKQAARLGLAVPWAEDVGADGRTVWTDRDGNAARLLEAITEEIGRRGLTMGEPVEVLAAGRRRAPDPEQAPEIMGETFGDPAVDAPEGDR